MKTITIKQPFASLIVEGIKDIENRTWPCPKKYIGQRVLIHAGMIRTNHIIRNVLNDAQYAEFRKKYKYSGLDFLEPMGAIIGSVEIVDCVINHESIWAEKTAEIKVGDIVKYKNTKGNIKNATITSFVTIEISGKIWFKGIDTQTKAKVWYPKHLSLELMGKKEVYNWVLANPIKFPKPIPAKGKLGFWESECEILICPKCNSYCLHQNHDLGVNNWGNPVHECEHCGYIILESEFEYLK